MQSRSEERVVVIGGGVVGCAVLHALARRGVRGALLEAEGTLALGASGANSGILHTGFDSPPGELETRLILRSAELREELLEELGVEAWRCGARLSPQDERERAAVAALARNAALNEVTVQLERDGSLRVPGESVTDPVAYVFALADAAQGAGASVRCNSRVIAVERVHEGAIALGLAGGEQVRARTVVNCAGLFADEIARLAGDGDLVSVYPRKGEFLVFRPPAGEELEEILLPVPSALGKGVLVFPTLERTIVAGPTAREREDKRDWSVEPDAEELIVARAQRMHPALGRAERVGSYAGLRPAGREANYVIEPSRSLPGLIHVAAIRSTGLSASLAIGEHVAELLAAETAIELEEPRALATPSPRAQELSWWRRAPRRREIGDA